MDNNKLYNALLKSQQERREADHSDKEPNTEDRFTRDRPYPGVRTDQPDWIELGIQGEGYPPAVYDPSVSLGLISNPHPWSSDELRERKIIYPGMPDKAVLDSYRELRIQLRNRANGHGSFSVLYSCLGQEECSVRTAFNLAAAFASDAGTAALLIDCDPHSKELSNLVSSPMDEGVTDYVVDPQLPVRKILYPSGVDRLTVIPAGTHSASAVELFSSTRMRKLLDELKGRYPDRCIIINAPPFRESTEARILVRFADQVILGVPFGQVTPEDISDSLESLGTEKFSGLVFQE